jgi:hypothetical protein
MSTAVRSLLRSGMTNSYFIPWFPSSLTLHRETPEGDTALEQLHQCWFPGAHADVGGGYPDTMSADITLAWMVSQLQKYQLLDFDTNYIKWVYQNNMASYKEHPRVWSTGKLNDSLSGIYDLYGRLARHPDDYYKTDPVSGETTKTPCRMTNEHVHASVRIRLGLGGKGLDDKGNYTPEALKGWSCKGVTGREADIYWERELKAGEKQAKIMPEDKLSNLELELLNYSNGIAPLDFWEIKA